MMASPLSSVRSYAYGYGQDFTLQSIRESAGAGNAGNAEIAGADAAEWAYEYDAIGRLAQARRRGGAGAGQYRYGYDKGDNLVLAETPENTQTFRPSPGNKLNQAHWRFDRAGNRIADERHTYRWDAADRLVGIGYKGQPHRRTEFRYDGHGRLFAAIEREGDKTMTKTFYTWCGNAICATRDGKGRPLARYFQGGFWRAGQGKAYYARDHLGSVRDVLDEQGRLLARHDYDPYGNLIGPGPGPDFGYAGMLRHAPSGLYLTRYRAYDPRSGRWLSRDPIGEAGGVNLYAYVGGNPVSYIDPLGLAKVCKRPLEGAPFMANGEPLDSNNVELSHQHIFLENGKKFYNEDKDIGYFDAGADSSGGVRADKPENLDKYSVCDPDNKYNDDIMINAVTRVRGSWRSEDYELVGHNCQGFVADVLEMYNLIANPPPSAIPTPPPIITTPPPIPPDFGLGQI